MPGWHEKARRVIPVLLLDPFARSATHVKRRDTRTVRHGDLVELTAVVRDVRPEGLNRSGVALEAVDLGTGKLGQELERIAAVVAPDLEDQRVVTAHELMDLGLRERPLENDWP